MKITNEINNCWLDIGVWGNSSCAKLLENIHCVNCKVFESAGTDLFNREPPEGYLDEWNDILAKEKEVFQSIENSFIIFRIEEEYMALSAGCVTLITDNNKVHSLPNKNSIILLGIANIRGEIKIVIDAKQLLGIETGHYINVAERKKIYKRMLVLHADKDYWAFTVDEIVGVKKIKEPEIGQVPSTLKRNSANFFRGIINDEEKKYIGVLDEKKLFAGISKNVF